MKTNLKLAIEDLATESTEVTEINHKKGNFCATKLLSGIVILSAMAVLNIFSASAFGIGCIPPCGPCQACQNGICVNRCSSCQTCQSGYCVTTCSPGPCETCVNGQCQSTCNSYLCEECIDGHCQSRCGTCETCEYGECQPACDASLCLTLINGVCRSWCDGVTQTCVSGACETKTWTYITYAYDEVGNRTSMADSFGTTAYTYDYLSRLTSVTNPDNKSISYQYDRNGNRTQLTDPADNVTTYTYDDDGQLETVTAPVGVTTYHYDSLDRQDRVDYPNGTYAVYSYHSQRNFLLSVTNKYSSDTELSSYTYTYDNVGNRQTVTENGTSVVSYTYDDIYQLESETRTGIVPYTISYQYDNVGNRTQMVKNAVTTTYTYNNNNQLITETAQGVTLTYSYDKNGNLLSKTGGGNTTTYAWDFRNLLLSVTEPAGTTVYEYDGAGTRISKTQSGVKTKYINDVAYSLVQVLMETDNAGTAQAIYNYGNDLVSMNRIGDEYSYYYLYDGLGSVRMLNTSSIYPYPTDFYDYDGFGNVILSNGSTTNTYGFTGEQQFGEADDLVFLRARYYKPSIGRFINRDPIGHRGGLNLYAYVNNNPVKWKDPSGEGGLVYCCISVGATVVCTWVAIEATDCSEGEIKWETTYEECGDCGTRQIDTQYKCRNSWRRFWIGRWEPTGAMRMGFCEE